MKPSVSRIVHFVENEYDQIGFHYAAVITHVWSDECVNLYVFPKCVAGDDRTGLAVTSVMYSAEPKSRTWHWPERDA